MQKNLLIDRILKSNDEMVVVLDMVVADEDRAAGAALRRAV
jgi:hypothetical protein